ncbi:NADAR domain-containing protein [Holdemania massiliensis]|uniref:NADAR domain-containing protein n=1 Tax=Holdemania massiliensis TaxID=1468449 RepID=UPI00351FF842
MEWYSLNCGLRGINCKVFQNEDLKEQLKATGNAVLAECAIKARIWGIGLSMNDPDRLDKSKWKGQNLLGYTLMMVRERL